MSTITRNAPAKINLTLHVGAPRPDRFHEIESLVARVGLHDTIAATPRDDGQCTLACDDPAIPCDDANLALRAAKRLAAASDPRDRGAHLTLQKRIPAGAGLGGGSSDAAAALLLLNELWQTRLSTPELVTLGAELGSDVPLFFHDPLCIVRGRGEIVRPAPRQLAGWATLILPEIHSATAAVYAAFDHTPRSPVRPGIDDVLQYADSAEQLMPHLFNDLEAPAFRVNPRLGELAESLIRLADAPVRLTGSGSAFFRLFDGEDGAREFARRVRDKLGLRADAVQLETR